MTKDQKKLYELKARVFQAVAHPIRLAIVDLLADGPVCVCNIAEAVQAERSNVSRHLSLMLKAGVVDCRKDGLKMIYSLKTPCIKTFLSCVTKVVRQKIKDSSSLLNQL